MPATFARARSRRVLVQEVRIAMRSETPTSIPGLAPDRPAADGLAEDAAEPPRHIRVARRVLEYAFGPPAEWRFAVRFWDGTVDRPPGRVPEFTMVLRDPSSLRRMLLPPSELRLGEAFVRGDFDVEGDLERATALAEMFRARVASLPQALRLVRNLIRLPSERAAAVPAPRLGASRRLAMRHSRRRDAAAVRAHYDVGNEFYSLWLDRRMVYSCAYFENGAEDIHAAQEAKLDHICRKLRLRRGERLLDIGCGWGGLLRYAVARYGVRGVGVTLSAEQAALARQRIQEDGLGTQCEILVQDYRETQDDEAFDKVVSVGMFEHVGPTQVRRYFAKVFRILKPGGLFLNHGLVNRAQGNRSTMRQRLGRLVWREGEFMDRYVFPDGELVTLDETVRCAETAGFETRDGESLREHYVLTLRHWVHRLEAAAAQAQDLVGMETYRVWRLYMTACAQSLATGRQGIVQLLLAKPDAGGRVNLPLTRRDLYGRRAFDEPNTN